MNFQEVLIPYLWKSNWIREQIVQMIKLLNDKKHQRQIQVVKIVHILNKQICMRRTQIMNVDNLKYQSLKTMF